MEKNKQYGTVMIVCGIIIFVGSLFRPFGFLGQLAGVVGIIAGIKAFYTKGKRIRKLF
jgi:predicted membrane protein